MKHAFKRLTALIMIMVFTCISLIGCTKQTHTNDIRKITLNEVAHSIFYAPQYVAIEKGYFKDEGIDLTLVTGFGADKVMTALISGDADIGFMGSEASVYIYTGGSSDYAVNFAQLTQRAGNFLVSRDNISNFKWSDVKGKTIIGGRAGGMPQMLLEYILKKNNIDCKKDVEIVQNIDFGSTAAAYCAKKSFLKNNPEIIQSFTNAIQKGLEFVNSHNSSEIAAVIAPQFKETDIQTLTKIVERYKSQDTWKNDTIFEESSFSLLTDILKQAGELDENVPYNKLVTTDFSKKAVK